MTKERLREWSFSNLSRVNIHPDAELATADQPTALRNTLQAMTDLQAPRAEVHFVGWALTDATAAALGSGLPALAHLRFAPWDLQTGLTDTLLGSVLRMGPCMREVRATGLWLESSKHTKIKWPWEKLVLGTAWIWDVQALLRLPNPKGLLRRPVVCCDSAIPIEVASVRNACPDAHMGRQHLHAGTGVAMQGHVPMSVCVRVCTCCTHATVCAVMHHR